MWKHLLSSLLSGRLLLCGGVLIVGCVEDNATAPPVMSALNEMQDIEEQKARERRESQGLLDQAREAQEAEQIDVPQSGTYEVEFDTTVGSFTIEVTREWAPRGAQRFYELVKDGFYDECAFFRVLPDFMAQFGIAASPEMNVKWNAAILDDPVIESNRRGYVTFAQTGNPNSRTTQVFINFKHNGSLDEMDFAPFGKVVSGMDVVDRISSEHLENPSQDMIKANGNSYLKSMFPKLDYIKSAKITVDDLTDSSNAETTEAPESDGRAE